ncbi:hypothetical protein PG988_009851 [Apiospora saccharicola]
MPEERKSDSLEAPDRKGLEDAGAHELAASSDSEDHFSDAQSAPSESAEPKSPVPITRVEKVDDEPSYGEVPGTEAYEKRIGDAAPDEVAVIPDPETESSAKDATTPTLDSQPVPKTVVDETADAPGSTTQHYHEDLRKADAAPDYIRKADGTGEASTQPASLETTGQATDDVSESPALKSPSKHRRRKSSAAKSMDASGEQTVDGGDEDNDDDFGDDFDDFEEGDEDADFGDFDDGFQQAEEDAPAAPPVGVPPSVSVPSFPILDLDGLDSEDVLAATEPYLNALQPDILQSPKCFSLVTTGRTATAPAPRLDQVTHTAAFSGLLGVPVDLDEILPASKQKKLVLPSLHRVTSNGSLRTSSESRSISRIRKNEGNGSPVSVDSQGKEKPGSEPTRRKGPLPAPELDLVSARQMCATTEEALNGMTDSELREHVTKLQEMEGLAKELLEYWKKRTDEKVGDRETFEGVIENLVKHARKTRK